MNAKSQRAAATSIESNQIFKNNSNSFWSFVKSRKSNSRIPEKKRFQDKTSVNVDESKTELTSLDVNEDAGADLRPPSF